jgi:hypothetical protein
VTPSWLLCLLAQEGSKATTLNLSQQLIDRKGESIICGTADQMMQCINKVEQI